MNDLIVMLGYCAVYAAWAFVPVLPVMFIYRLFPKSETHTEWKVAGIQVKAGGATAIYLALVAFGYVKLIDPTIERINSLNRPYWEVKTRVQFVDDNQKIIDAKSSENQLQVRPLSYGFEKIGDRMYLLTLHFAQPQGDVPDYVTFQFPEGEGFLNLKQLKTKNMSISLKTIDLTGLKPIFVVPVRSSERSQFSGSGISHPTRAVGTETPE